MRELSMIFFFCTNGCPTRPHFVALPANDMKVERCVMRVIWSMTESLIAHYVHLAHAGGGGQRERDKDQRGSRTIPPSS